FALLAGARRLSPPFAPSSPSPHLPALITIGEGGEEAAAPGPGAAAGHLFPEHHLTIMLFSSCFFSCRFHMGNLLKVLTYNELDQGPNFFLDFEICSLLGPARGWGLLGDPREQDRGRRAARTHPPPSPPSTAWLELGQGDGPGGETCQEGLRAGGRALDAESEVNNEMANRMSLFYAEATPMLKTLSNATTKFVSENKTLPIEDTTDCLSTMACVCRVMLETPEYRSRFTNTETLLFCMRVMVGVIILYDHVHPVGAFAKTSKIDMKGCIKVLKDQPSTSTEGLLNALR
ncbi:PREDICTED: uncharacterized protein LOC103898537, partial [Aptenodytes forsteri]|uniref:uncharacterized protein LOC103898537 n=1 Tax=Aptenodytes forsteri TaxID=9233 RepID=UPI0009058733